MDDDTFYQHLIQKSIDDLGEFVYVLEQEVDKAIDETAKRENKTRDQVINDWMKPYEGKTWGEFWKEMKDKYDRT